MAARIARHEVRVRSHTRILKGVRVQLNSFDVHGGRLREIKAQDKVPPNSRSLFIVHPYADGEYRVKRAQWIGAFPVVVCARKLVIPIPEKLPLSEAAEAQAKAEKGGAGKILLVA